MKKYANTAEAVNDNAELKFATIKTPYGDTFSIVNGFKNLNGEWFIDWWETTLNRHGCKSPEQYEKEGYTIVSVASVPLSMVDVVYKKLQSAKVSGKTSEKKAASSAANGAKGGRPKGSKNKPKEV